MHILAWIFGAVKGERPRRICATCRSPFEGDGFEFGGARHCSEVCVPRVLREEAHAARVDALVTAHRKREQKRVEELERRLRLAGGGL